MSVDQKVLRVRVADRIRGARPEMADRDLSTVAGLLSVDPDTETGATVVCVVARFDLTTWIRETCAFAAALPAEVVPAWRRSFTRTIFLTGNPTNLHDRFTFAHVAEDRSAAWTPPLTPQAAVPLRVLLKLFAATAELPCHGEFPVVLAGDRPAPSRRALYVTTCGVTVADCLVHLNHLLVEAVLDGLLRPGDELLVRQVPRLVGVRARLAALRVGPDPADATRLRAYAALTEELSG